MQSIRQGFKERFGHPPSSSAVNRFIVYKTLQQLSIDVRMLPFAVGFTMDQVYKHVDRIPSLGLSVGLYIYYERARRYLAELEYYGPQVEFPITTEGFVSAIQGLSRFFPSSSLMCAHKECRRKALYSHFCDECIRFEWPEIAFGDSPDHFLVWKCVHSRGLTEQYFQGMQGCHYRLHEVCLPRGIANFTPSPLGALAYSEWSDWVIGSVVLGSEVVMNGHLIFDSFGPVLPVAAFPAQQILGHYGLSRQDIIALLDDINRLYPRIDQPEHEISLAAVRQMQEKMSSEQALEALPKHYWHQYLDRLLPYKKNNLAAELTPPQTFSVPF